MGKRFIQQELQVWTNYSKRVLTTTYFVLKEILRRLFKIYISRFENDDLVVMLILDKKSK